MTALRSRQLSSVRDPTLAASLQDLDPEIFDIIEKEKQRQRNSIDLIPSENFTSRAVLEALGSVMQNKYSEGYPGARYYGGNEFIDQSESACQRRALETFHLDPEKWGVNVQTLSGSPANFATYSALLQPHERILALDLPHGGHLSHGYQIPGKKISAVSVYFETVPYRLDESTGLIDYDLMETIASVYRPKIIVAGTSAYSRLIDYDRFRRVADKHNAFLMSDMAHISGLVAARAIPSPFEYSDVVTTTTHKSLRGPRGAMVFYRKGVRSVDKKGNEIMYDIEDKINQAVFPGLQGGPHNHTITALAVALKLAQSAEFKKYQEQVISNSKFLVQCLQQRGFEIVSGGTDNHLALIDLRPKGITGSKLERITDLAGIALNKNTVPGDRSAMNPGGIRIGTPAMTTRGLVETDFEKVAEFLARATQIAIDVQAQAGSKKIVDFNRALDPLPSSLVQLQEEVVDFSRQFPTIGFEESSMVYAS